MRAALALLALSLAAGAAQAAECRQEHAIYADGKAAYEIAFEPVGSAAAAASHHFKVKVRASGTVLDGIVMPGERSNGMILDNCPEGDATGAEIAACTVWEGVVYALDGGGEVSVLPGGSETAAAYVLLAGFGPSLRYSRLWDEGKATVVPWDVFARKGCGA
jgi:hypothetical protein